MKEVQGLQGFHKANTSAYHLQTDGFVERFNRTLTTMLAKTSKKGGPDWDQHLPYVLFAYRTCQQQSTKESPFYLLYGRDPRLPNEAMLCPAQARRSVHLQEYGQQLRVKMSEAWELAQHSVGHAQSRQKKYYDKRQRPPTFSIGNGVFLFKPAEKTGEGQKLVHPYYGPFCVVEMGTNTTKIRRVDKPQEEPILVSLDCLRRCPEEVPDVSREYPTNDKVTDLIPTTDPNEELGLDVLFQEPEPVSTEEEHLDPVSTREKHSEPVSPKEEHSESVSPKERQISSSDASMIEDSSTLKTPPQTLRKTSGTPAGPGRKKTRKWAGCLRGSMKVVKRSGEDAPTLKGG